MRNRVAAYALIVRGEGDGREILLPHWYSTARGESQPMHGWTLPGGGLNEGEHPAEAARREVFEETGYLVKLTGLLGVDAAVVDTIQAIRVLYRAEVVAGSLTIEQDGSTNDVAWHRIDEVANLRHVHSVDWALRYLDDPGTPLR